LCEAVIGEEWRGHAGKSEKTAKRDGMTMSRAERTKRSGPMSGRQQSGQMMPRISFPRGERAPGRTQRGER